MTETPSTTPTTAETLGKFRTELIDAGFSEAVAAALAAHAGRTTIDNFGFTVRSTETVPAPNAAIPHTFTCECGEFEHPVAPGADESIWCTCGARIDQQRARLTMRSSR